MNWNISNIETINNNGYEEIIINGFSPVEKNYCLKTIITKTTLEDALDSKNDKYKLNKTDYHEGYGLSIVNKNLVYIIDIDLYENQIEYNNMKNKPFIPLDETISSNNKYYMDLPITTYLMWKGMVTTEL